MNKHIIDSQLLLSMLESGSNNLANRFKEVDALNVFPVPDGDTGTNMSLTFTAGVQDALKLKGSDVGAISKALSKGLLMGARGNSGVILSQIFRGFYQSVETLESLSVQNVADAFVKGSEVAYKAVMRPVEGTILTVIRESSYMAHKYVQDNPEITVDEYFAVLLEEANKSLEYTPELLPVLKEVGVVDSGGAGLIVILEGFKSAIEGTVIQIDQSIAGNFEGAQTQFESDEFGYCTEFIVRLEENAFLKFSEDKFRKQLEKLGDSLVVVQDDDLVKVHVHTLRPGDALNIGQTYGEFVKLKIENMQEQHDHIVALAEDHDVVQEHKEFGVITVGSGSGLQEYFKELRADIVINGGQTMNPSTEDFVAAINKVNADNVFILPNNSNIILAANQAKDVVTDKNVIVIPSKTIAQGLVACLMFNPSANLEDNVTEMTEALEKVKTGQITTAIKDTTFEGLEISEGNFMGILEKNIVVSESDLLEVAKHLLDRLLEDDCEIVTIIQGEDGTDKITSLLEDYVQTKFDVEVEVIKGKQPVYHYIFGAE